MLTKGGVEQLPWDLLALHIGQVLLRGCGVKQPPPVPQASVVPAPTTAPDVPPQA